MGGMSKEFMQGAGGLMVTTGVDCSTKLWVPAYSNNGPLVSFLSNSSDYMYNVSGECDSQECNALCKEEMPV